MAKELRNRDLLNGLSNAEETQDLKEKSGEQLIEKIPVEGTPFNIIRTEDKCFGVYGKIRITDVYRTVPEVHEKLEKFNWEVATAIIIQIAEAVARETIKEDIKNKQRN